MASRSLFSFLVDYFISCMLSFFSFLFLCRFPQLLFIYSIQSNTSFTFFFTLTHPFSFCLRCPFCLLLWHFLIFAPIALIFTYQCSLLIPKFHDVRWCGLVLIVNPVCFPKLWVLIFINKWLASTGMNMLLICHVCFHRTAKHEDLYLHLYRGSHGYHDCKYIRTFWRICSQELFRDCLLLLGCGPQLHHANIVLCGHFSWINLHQYIKDLE